jgi:putative phage-type endonuclease
MTFDRAAWLQWRRLGVGASDIAAIVGLSPWQSPYSLWCEKVGLTEGQAETEAMAHGRYAEHAIKAWFEDNYELRVVLQQQWMQHPTFEWARCTPDGFLVEGGLIDAGETVSAIGLIEFKVADFKVWDDIPDNYQCQAQYQMLVTGQSNVVFAVQHGKRFVRYDLERDDDDIRFLRDAAESFWEDFVCAGVAPDVDGHQATASALGHRWQASDNSVDFDDDLSKIVEELRAAKVEQKWWDDRRALLENQIKEAMADATIARADGQIVATWKPSTRASIDLKELRSVHPEICDMFTTVTESRRFLLKESK